MLILCQKLFLKNFYNSGLTEDCRQNNLLLGFIKLCYMYRGSPSVEDSFVIHNYLDMAFHEVCLESYYYVGTAIL